MSLGTLKNAAAASVTTGNATFAFAAGQKLNLLIGGPSVVIAPTSSPIYGGVLIEIAFAASMFANIAAATAAELAAVLNAAFVAQAVPGQPPPAVATVSGSTVVITSALLGGKARIQVLASSDAAVLTALSLTAGTIAKGSGFSPGDPQPPATFHDVVNFAGDGAYPTGGSVGLLAKMQALYGDTRKPFAVVPLDCGGYVPAYIEATDKLKVYKSAGSAIALAEVANNADLSATTFNLLVLSR
jgi:hypothetical protein